MIEAIEARAQVPWPGQSRADISRLTPGFEEPGQLDTALLGRTSPSTSQAIAQGGTRFVRVVFDCLHPQQCYLVRLCNSIEHQHRWMTTVVPGPG